MATYYCISSAMNAFARTERGHNCRKWPRISRQNCSSRVGTWNAGGLNGDGKRREVINVFKNGKFELLVLTETKVKGSGEDEWCGVKCVYAGVERNVRAKKGVTILMNDAWHKSMVKFECVSSRVLMAKFN